MKVRAFNIRFEISYTLICIFAICIILNQFKNFLFCILAVIIHESGHIALMCFFNSKPQKIKIKPFEIIISDDKRHLRTTKENFFIIFFGPFANFICVILFYLLYLLCNTYFLNFALINLFVGVFNSLPVISLDGGQLLYIFLCRYISGNMAHKIVNIISFIFIFPLSALGFILLFNSAYNFSLLAVSLYLMLSLVLKKDSF